MLVSFVNGSKMCLPSLADGCSQSIQFRMAKRHNELTYVSNSIHLVLGQPAKTVVKHIAFSGRSTYGMERKRHPEALVIREPDVSPIFKIQSCLRYSSVIERLSSCVLKGHEGVARCSLIGPDSRRTACRVDDRNMFLD